MMKGFVLMAFAFTAYFIREVWTLCRFRREIIYPYPFAPQQYNYVQTFWSMYASYAFAALFSYILWQAITNNKVFWFCVFILQLAELIEYRLNYNLAWCVADFGVTEIPVNITTIRYVVLLLAFIYELITFLYGRNDRTPA